MSKDIQKVRKKLYQKRKRRYDTYQRERRKQEASPPSYHYYPHHPDAPYHEPEFYVWQQQEKEGRKADKQKSGGGLVIQSFLAATLFLLVLILFQSPHPALEGARGYIETAFEEEFSFATATKWYEEHFGSPLAFLPFETSMEREVTSSDSSTGMSIPVNATVTESFSENGKGIIFETGEDDAVVALKGGVVIHAGPHEEWDLAVGIDHYDGGEAWYGLMESIDVKLYDHIAPGTVLGKGSEEETGNIRFSLALMEEGKYVDPVGVMRFD
ncbi:peptidoglycan DD-metalloendopeptidase family protein [Aliibacillus thermotolerans]|uniref:Peptidoglycan DD-metalloendopeptidase family protein n=1 Tax=Aliibacillus thermotolerans TaxID=1834418 RepID=A0ABW0U4W9_9BACI|nr:M23 family metallopeptidase [Aliibacillus thermotolerans]MDA3129263.1 peptidoglycan DD-metalloendopeptidase family protein [Aliibacillus thermotolerans]